MRALAGVADKEFEKAEQVAGMYGSPAYREYSEMIEELKLDGIIISTPTGTHAEIAEAIAKKYDGLRGILIEKPLASTLRDAKKVADTLRKRRVCTLIGHSEIYNPVVERALELIHRGEIGQPHTVIHDRRGYVQPSRIASLGDVFEDIGVHDFDIMSRISKGPAKLYAQCNTRSGILNMGTVMVKFESGTEHFFHLSRQYVGRKRSMDVSGSKGTLSLDLFGQIIKIQDLDEAPEADGRTLSLPERGATIKVYGEPVQQVITDFLNCIETSQPPKVGLDDGLLALEIVEAARKSAKDEKPIDINIQSKHL